MNTGICGGHRYQIYKTGMTSDSEKPDMVAGKRIQVLRSHI